ncbi:MAG: transglycosylase domain-containing protein [Leadbetterella sp.]
MSFIKTIKEYQSKVFTFFRGILVLFVEVSYKLVEKVIGKQNAKKLNVTLLNFSSKTSTLLYGHLDAKGRNFNLIRTIYSIFYKSTFGICLYLFLIKTNFLWLTGKMPSIEQLQNPKLAQASTIISADGVEIGKYFTENRVPVDSNQISPWVFKSLVATEDKRFNQHSGIDLKRMGGVLIGMLKGSKSSGGGSTISQQLAKNLYDIRKKEMHGLLYYIRPLRVLIQKSKEWITAVDLEKRFTKGELLTLYLNTMDYGNNSFGIKSAAKTYFNKSPLKLNASEAAVLIGLQAATTKFNPIRNPENSKNRRNIVLKRLYENGDLTQEELEKLSSKDIELNVNLEDNFDGQGNYFKIALAKYLEKWAEENEEPLDLYQDGLKIYTTIDSRMQNYGEESLKKHMKMLQKEFDAQWRDKNPWVYENGEEIPDFIEKAAQKTVYYKQLQEKYGKNSDSISYYMNQPRTMKVFSWNGQKTMTMSHMDSLRYYKKFLQSGMMAFDPYTGFVKAWVGGNDFDYFKYDHVNQGKRQPGSSFKPIVYTAAIDGPLNLSPCERRKDQPITMKWRENGIEKTWQPKNANGRYSHSNMTLRTAISQSVNTIAVQLVQEMKPPTVIEYAKKMGIKSTIENVTSVALGTSEVSLFELIGAYGVFLNEGTYREPIIVYKIEDKSGKVLYNFEPETHEAISRESAYLMQFMLRGNVEEGGGTGRRLLGYSNIFANDGQAAGKTGTTSNNSDAWYVGFTKDLVCGVWVGGEDRSIHFRGGLGEGSKSALPIFGLFMDKVYADKSLGFKAGPFPKPTFEIEKDYQDCAYISRGTYRVDSLSLNDSSMISIGSPNVDSIPVKDNNPNPPDSQAPADSSGG